jgi:hypothetical protein
VVIGCLGPPQPSEDISGSMGGRMRAIRDAPVQVIDETLDTARPTSPSAASVPGALNQRRKHNRTAGVVDVGRDAHLLQSDLERSDVPRPHVHDRIG